MSNGITDKSALPRHIQELQKKKNTFDSPCMSICNYGEDSICETCFLAKSEKMTWKATQDKEIKDKILNAVIARRDGN